jgi:hypothetical protein
MGMYEKCLGYTAHLAYTLQTPTITIVGLKEAMNECLTNISMLEDEIQDAIDKESDDFFEVIPSAFPIRRDGDNYILT